MIGLLTLICIVLALAAVGALVDAVFAHNQITELTKDIDNMHRLLRVACFQTIEQGHVRRVDIDALADALATSLARRQRIRGKR